MRHLRFYNFEKHLEYMSIDISHMVFYILIFYILSGKKRWQYLDSNFLKN